MILYYLSFVIDFKLSLNQKQDFLFFEGVNDSAHLFRQNSTILLNVNNELYKTDIVDRIQFSWKGFKVNGSEMEKIKSTGEGEILTFDAFTFLSPIVKISKEEEEAKEEYFHSFLSQKINYYYIFAIVFLTVLLVDGIEILLSGAAGAMRGFPARLSCAAILYVLRSGPVRQRVKNHPRVRNKGKGPKKTPLFWSILSLYPLLNFDILY